MQKQTLSTFALVMLIAGAIDSIRNLPATALFGGELIFFFILAAIIFLLPTALLSAQLSATYPDKGGVFDWVSAAFGDRWGFLAIWLQWINTMVWYPTILSFVAGTAAYLIDPSWASHPGYLVCFILALFWLLTLINLRGLQTSATFAAVCAVLGLVIPMLLIIGMACAWVCLGHPLQIHFGWHVILPHFSGTQDWLSLTAIMASFLGMELATVHVKDIKNAQTQFPKALLIAVIIILATMILGSLSIAIVLPSSSINLMQGVLQAFHSFLAAYHLSWMMPFLTLMIIVGAVGGMINWLISPAKGLLLAGQSHFLPRALCHVNSHGVANRILIVQGLVVSVICLAFLLMPSVNGSYWLLTDLSTELYMIMYALLFVAAIVLRYRDSGKSSAFKIPGKKFGTTLVGVLGLLGVALTLVVGFIPPRSESINVGTAAHYEVIFVIGLLVMLLPTLLFYAYKKRLSTLKG